MNRYCYRTINFAAYYACNPSPGQSSSRGFGCHSESKLLVEMFLFNVTYRRISHVRKQLILSRFRWKTNYVSTNHLKQIRTCQDVSFLCQISWEWIFFVDINFLFSAKNVSMDQKQKWSLDNRFHNLYTNGSTTVDHEWHNSNAILLLFICYAVVIFGGVFGNATLVFSICSQPTGRLRRPLLFALCLADLAVVCISAPLTIVLLSLAYASWPLQSIGCKAIHYLRVSAMHCTKVLN